jgi:hypothetical protein
MTGDIPGKSHRDCNAEPAKPDGCGNRAEKSNELKRIAHEWVEQPAQQHCQYHRR